MFDSVAHRYDLTNAVLSFGIHKWWELILRKSLPQNPKAVVLDLCTGTGALLPMLERRFVTVYGVDFSAEMLARAKVKTAILEQGDAHALRFEDASFDLVTIAYGVRNFSDRPKALSEVFRVLKPGGSLRILEFGRPQNFLWRGMYNFYSKWIMPVVGRLLTGDSAAYTYLPETVARFPSGQTFLAELTKIGFVNLKATPLTGGITYLYEATK